MSRKTKARASGLAAFTFGFSLIYVVGWLEGAVLFQRGAGTGMTLFAALGVGAVFSIFAQTFLDD